MTTYVAVDHQGDPVREFDTAEEAEAYIADADALGGAGWTVEEKGESA